MARTGSSEKDDSFIVAQDQDDTQDSKEMEGQWSEKELRMVIVGRTGSGISSLGNHILQKACFNSKRSLQSVTKKSSRGEASRNGKTICVVETPGLYNTSFPKDYIEREIIKSLSLVAPGPHAVLYVCRVGRHSEEELQSLKWFSNIFGDDVFKYTVVVFSGKDFLNGEDINQWLEILPAPFRSFLQKCNRRYISVNSQAYGHESDKQLNELLSIVQLMVSSNVPLFFSKKESLPRSLFTSIKRQACHLIHFENHSKKRYLCFALFLALCIYGRSIFHTLYVYCNRSYHQGTTKLSSVS